MTKQEASPARFFIGLLALATVVVQLVGVPRAGAAYAGRYPDVAYLEPLCVTALMVAPIGLEIALLSVWKLVSAALTDRVSSTRSRRWTNIMAASLIFTPAIFVSIFVHAGSVAGVGGPAMLFGLLVSLALVPLAFVLKRWVREWFRNENAFALSTS
jgi:hypothetical protein